MRGRGCCGARSMPPAPYMPCCCCCCWEWERDCGGGCEYGAERLARAKDAEGLRNGAPCAVCADGGKKEAYGLLCGGAVCTCGGSGSGCAWRDGWADAASRSRRYGKGVCAPPGEEACSEGWRSSSDAGASRARLLEGRE